MVILTNPLTSEERLSVTRLIGHDIMSGTLNPISCQISLSNGHQIPIKENTGDYVHSTASFLRTIYGLTQRNDYDTAIDFEFQKSSPYSIKKLIEVLNTHHEDKIIDSVNNFSNIYLAQDFIYCSLHNLVKNALWHNSRTAHELKNGKLEYEPNSIELIVEKAKFPQNPTFVPEEAKDYSDFLAFRVNDTGEGFPQDKDWKEYFTTCPPKGEHGFGLYFNGLVAKVLRAPIEIQSIPGNTIVSFYHPIYPE